MARETRPLSETHPELAEEANGWDPKTVIAGTNKKLTWRCSIGHAWDASGNDRVRGAGCPYCSNHTILAGFNDLATTHPELASEADGWDPTTVIAGTNQKLAWRCSLGHPYNAVGSSRVRGSGCGICANKTVLTGFNDLATTHPELASEADGWDPTTVIAGTGKKLTWRCSIDHAWDASGRDRVRGAGCPYCSNHLILVGFNDLATTHPELASEADGWDPTTVIAGTGKKLPWRCSIGHPWKAAGSTRLKGSGCGVCANQIVLAGFNDLATTHPELAEEANGWDPTTVIAGTHTQLAWHCSLGHSYNAAGSSRVKGSGCGICDNKIVLVGFNDMATTHPDLASEADGWDPTTVIAGTHKKLSWRCSLGHPWKVSGSERVLGRGCGTCANKTVLTGFNDLATTHPELASEADGWDPTTVIAGTDKILAWRCSLGHPWKATGNSRIGGSGCGVCANRIVLAGVNDMATTHPDFAAEAYGWDPTAVLAGTHKKLSWRCSLGHPWETTGHSRTNQGSGCPTCAKFGYSPGNDGYLYLLRHELWGLLQIGISNVPDVRLTTHRRSGWQVIELRGPMLGDVAYGWEQSILKALTDRDVSLSPAHIAGTFSGYTESWIEEDFPASSLKELMALVHGDEGD